MPLFESAGRLAFFMHGGSRLAKILEVFAVSLGAFLGNRESAAASVAEFAGYFHLSPTPFDGELSNSARRLPRFPRIIWLRITMIDNTSRT